MSELSLRDLCAFTADKERFAEAKLLRIKGRAGSPKYDIARRLLSGEDVDCRHLGLEDYVWVHGAVNQMSECLRKFADGLSALQVDYCFKWQVEVGAVCLKCSIDRVYRCAEQDVLVEYKFGARSVAAWAGYAWERRCEAFYCTPGGEVRRVKPKDYNEELGQCTKYLGNGDVGL